MIMQLKSSAESVREYLSLSLLVDKINKHESTQEYVVTKRRIKVFKRGVLMKAWIQCDRDERREQDEGSEGQISEIPDAYMTTFLM